MNDESSPLLDEVAETLRGLYGSRMGSLVIERLVVGVFFVGVKFSNGYGASPTIRPKPASMPDATF